MRCDLVPPESVDDAFCESWRALAAGAVTPNPFHEPECVLPAVRELAPPGTVKLLTVTVGAELRFLLPVHRVRRTRKLPLPGLAAWRHPYAFLANPLLARGTDPAETWEAVLGELSHRSYPPLLLLELFAADDPSADALRALARPTVFETHDRAVLHRRADATYLDGRMSGRHRKDLRRGREQLAADLGGDLGCVDRAAEDDATFEVALTDFLRLESAGWKGRDGGAIACRAEHERFFRALAAGLRRHGRFELWSLGAAGRTAAYQCNLLAGNTAFRIKAAYDEQVARHSPGVQLELDLMAVFHDDDRLQVVDSCTAAGSMTYEQLYADRRTVETWLVPLHGRRARLAAAASPALARGYQRLRRSA